MESKRWQNLVNEALVKVVCDLPQAEATDEEITKRAARMAAEAKRIITGISWFSVPKAVVAEHVANAIHTMAGELGWRGRPALARSTDLTLKQVYRRLSAELPAELGAPFTAWCL